MSYNLLNKTDFEKFKKNNSNKFKYDFEGGAYLNLQNLDLESLPGIEVDKLNKIATLMRELIFATVEGSRSGHPGGSSSKVEQFLGLTLGGALAFDPLEPKNTCRDRVIWSAGHCTPGLYSGLALFYESLKKKGVKFDAKKLHAVLARDLAKFRRAGGLPGHAESYTPLSDISTGPSGHGFSAAGGLAITHKSAGTGSKVWVFMGDAESEEGMTYEARNLLHTVGADNMIVSLDYNNFGIDGDISEVLSNKYINNWLGLGWNVIEINGHNILECVYAYRLAAQKVFDNNNPTVVIAHTIKGEQYGSLENTNKSHGEEVSHEEYVRIERNLDINKNTVFPDAEGDIKDDLSSIELDLDIVLSTYIVNRLKVSAKNIPTEKKVVAQMKKTLSKRKFQSVTSIKRPLKLPKELIFEAVNKVATRKASQAFFEYLMKESAFFWAGAGDLSESVKTDKAENVFGVINKQNPYGRGIRYGIAEQNMGMMGTGMTLDRLPGSFAPASVIGTYAAFTSMMCNGIRVAVINNHLYPAHKGFFIVLASHDGPEVGEDGPTHQGLYWMSMFTAYPGIKVYKPTDANETIEMLFHAIKIGEPIVLSVSRPDVAVLKRGKNACCGQTVPSAKEAINGAYIFKDYKNNGKQKMCVAVSGAIVLNNLLQILPELENENKDVKIVVVTSPELFAELKKKNKKKAESIFNSSDRKVCVTLHAGWKGFLRDFIDNDFYDERSIGLETYLESGSVDEVYEMAKLSSEDIKKKLLGIRF
ncbi:MAG: 1-deoxy-D-xylulose-5-phosphate synthase N-terminal domain-containing protein [Candidatus Magasanikbacteria bacterium]